MREVVRSTILGIDDDGDDGNDDDGGDDEGWMWEGGRDCSLV